MIDLSNIDLRPRFGKAPVSASAELRRILALPRRTLEATWTPAHVAALEARLRRDPAPNERLGWPCVCASMGRDCPLHLRKIQAFTLLDAEACNGALGAIGVGHGKTLLDLTLPMVIPGCRVAILLIKANLQAQLLERDIPYYGAHWRIPYVVGRSGIAEISSGAPKLHVVTYDKLSQQDGTNLLLRIGADTIILDEAQALADPEAARTLRFLRYCAERPGVRLVAMSGSIVSRSVKQVWHFGALALKQGSPFPLKKETAEEWGTALDPAKIVAPVGALAVFAGRQTDDAAEVRRGFQKWLSETPGVICSGDNEDVESRLVLRARSPQVPPEIKEAIDLARRGERPDGEQFTEQLQVIACARQLACGFFHRWRYPRGESPELIMDWFAKRQAWNRAVRKALERPQESFDSPGLVEKAAELGFYERTVVSGKHGDVRAREERVRVPVRIPEWAPWRDVRDLVQPDSEAVWMHDFLVRDCAEWARANVGIVWVEYPELGERIAAAAGIPWYGGGDEASAVIIRETGKRSIVASIRAHGTGKNLQPFSRNLVATPPGDGGTWEQLTGRTYRPGQRAEVVTVEVALHTDEFVRAFTMAHEQAHFAEQLTGSPQRLCFASYE